jgi:hypothetical protein
VPKVRVSVDGEGREFGAEEVSGKLIACKRESGMLSGLSFSANGEQRWFSAR